MAKGAISKKDSSEDRIANQASDSELSDIHESMHLIKIFAEGGHLLPARRRVAMHLAIARFFAREKSENAREELTQAFYSTLASSPYPQWSISTWISHCYHLAITHKQQRISPSQLS